MNYNEFLNIYNNVINNGTKQGEWIIKNNQKTFNNVSSLFLYNDIYVQKLGEKYIRIFSNKFDILADAQTEKIIIKFNKQ
jgi:hypothetical protein